MNIQIDQIKGKGFPLHGNDIDTDRIIPARFLKEITFTNMGKYLFYDERFDESGKEKSHIFNDQRFQGASILIVNKNFGCGSSREHAAHAIKKFGINAVIGESFSSIFAANCLSLGIPAVQVSPEDANVLMQAIEKDPSIELFISITEKTIEFQDNLISFVLPLHIEKALLTGRWNSTGMMLNNIDAVKETANKLAYLNNFI